MTQNIGMPEAGQQSVAQKLTVLLADTYLLYVKTQNFHWNVTGPNFHSLHEMFEHQYQELADAVDSIAERVRALGQRAPGSFKEFSDLTTLNEAGVVTEGSDMLKELSADHESIIRSLRDMLPAVTKVDDEVTISLLTDRMSAHEKMAWMLRSSL